MSTTTTASSSTWCSTSPSSVPSRSSGATTRSPPRHALDFDGVLLSPGPGTPEAAGVCIDMVRAAAGHVPVLGVCLGHQAIAVAYGGTVGRAPELLHGKTSLVEHDGVGVLEGLPEPFTATRYHSLAVEPASMPAELEVTGTYGRRRDHGAAAPRARRRGRAVPPGVRPHRGRPPTARQLARRRAATRTPYAAPPASRPSSTAPARGSRRSPGLLGGRRARGRRRGARGRRRGARGRRRRRRGLGVDDVHRLAAGELGAARGVRREDLARRAVRVLLLDCLLVWKPALVSWRGRVRDVPPVTSGTLTIPEATRARPGSRRDRSARRAGSSR